LKRFAERHPVAYVVLIWLMTILFYVVGGAAAAVLSLGPLGGIIATVPLALISLVILARANWWEETGLAVRVESRVWRYLALPLLWWAGMIVVKGGFAAMGLREILTVVATAALSGYVEEVYYRGIMMRALASKGAVWAIGMSTLLFGFTHALNVLAGRNGLDTLIQIGYALAIGFYFGTVAWKTRAVGALALVHGVNNLIAGLVSGGLGGPSAAPTPAEMALSALVALSAAGYALYLLRAPERQIAVHKTA
jgi:membrane protease YdiL (CAAX protease family)